ncbi:hypothetical protein CRSA0334_16785 [Cronobacter malonaticus ENBT0334]|nr:hypothetical protein CRSA0334_16785 [Cronobacter malonaticus ENBT0334]
MSQEKLLQIAAAAEKLVRCKGRYHSEQNYRALAALFGVTTPDLPPLEGEALRERAEPVAWTGKCEITNMRATGLYLRGFPDSSQGRDIPLYTAPPAPVEPGWIACSERMPKIGDEIFYYCEDDGIRDCGIVGSSNFTGRGDPELFVHSEGFDLHLGADITHWMPLPEAPGKN